MDEAKALRSRLVKYMLVDGKIVETNDLIEWAKWWESSDRIIAKDHLTPGIEVSTVFLGIDHGFGCIEKPLLFETMIFGGPQDGFQDRYFTIEEAEAGHKRAVARAWKPADESDD